ncbi:MAG: hypothetical protein LBU74_03735 [Methanobacteriaceae archaeon]|nr:hypothetical protein [Candidatus Methanorudis spinitermitis]
MRIKKIKSQKKFENTIDEYITMGYKLKSQNESSIKLKKENIPRMIIHGIIMLILFFQFFNSLVMIMFMPYQTKDLPLLFSMILLTIIAINSYYMIKSYKGEEILIKIEK